MPVHDFDDFMHVSFCRRRILDPIGNSHLPIFELVLLVPTLLYVAFLIYTAKRSIQRLLASESLIMPAFYLFVWTACLFNLSRIVLAILYPSFPHPTILYEILFSVMSSILIFFEVSVVIFMSDAYSMTGREPIKKTLWISLILCIIYGTIQMVLLFAFDIHLFLMESDASKLYWLCTMAVISAFYLLVLAHPLIPCNRWTRLPAYTTRPYFYYYASLMLVINVLRLLGVFIAVFDLDIGFCLWDLGQLLFYTLFVPFLYWAFLRDFFKEARMSDKYEEMVVSGYFDSDT